MKPSVAIVHDWLVSFGGAERVLEALLEMYPDAPIYTLVYRPDQLPPSPLKTAQVHTSLINRLPFAGRAHRSYLPLMPLAVEQLDLRGFDIVISVSHAVAHGVLLRPDQLHINYILTPARFAWHQYQEYLSGGRLQRGLRGWIAKPLLHYFRLWDQAAASRVDHFVAISQWIADAVQRAYRREAAVIYPPVDIERFRPLQPREDYYICVARLVTNKRIDLIVSACSQLKRRLLVVGEGPEMKRLRRIAGDSIEFLGWVDDEALADLLGRARAFIHAAEEDFGIAPIEAMAAGCPVIGYGRGALLETVVRGKTGEFFHELTVDSLIKAIQGFEVASSGYEPDALRAHALQFRKERFKTSFRTYAREAWDPSKRAEHN